MARVSRKFLLRTTTTATTVLLLLLFNKESILFTHPRTSRPLGTVDQDALSTVSRKHQTASPHAFFTSNDTTSIAPAPEPRGTFWPHFQSDVTFDQTRLLYAKVPKTGSTTLGDMIKLVSKSASMHWNDHNYYTSNLEGFRRKRFVDRAMVPGFTEEHPEKAKKTWKFRGLGLMGHFRFLDFREFGQDNPIWISQVRDPVERFISRFHFTREKRKDLYAWMKEEYGEAYVEEWRFETLSDCVLEARHGPERCAFEPMVDEYDPSPITYFCGFYEGCALHGSEAALRQAKANVEEFFPVVGLLENLNETLLVLEMTMPDFLKGLSKHNVVHKNVRPKQDHVMPDVKDRLRQTFALEYDLYEFLKSRLLKQYNLLT